MRSREFIIEYKREVTLRNYGQGILNAWKTGVDYKSQHPYAEFTILGLDADEISDEAIVNSIIGKMEFYDPTSNKIYTPWLAREYVNGNIKRLEDLSGFTPLLSDYHRYKNLGDFPQEAKNIMQLSAVPRWRPKSFFAVLDDYSPPDSKITNRGNAKTVYEDNEVRVIHPKDEAAACYYGQGTRWCTAATRSRNYFDDYNDDGPLFIILPKKPKHQGEKFQVHFPSAQFTNEHDDQVGIEEILRKRFPQLVSVFKELGQHPEEYIALFNDAVLLKMFNVGAKLIIDNINENVVNDNKEIPIQYYKDQLEDWFDGYNAKNIRSVINYMELNGEDINLYYNFPHIFSHILRQSYYDFEEHNRRTFDPDNRWTLYFDDKEVHSVIDWITSKIRVSVSGDEFLRTSKGTKIPVEGTDFVYILLT